MTAPALFVRTGLIATTFVRIDDQGFRSIEVDEKPAKRLPKAPPFDLDEVARHAQRDVSVPLAEIARVAVGPSDDLEVVTREGARHLAFLNDAGEVERAFAALEARLGCERRLEEVSAMSAAVAPIAGLILTGGAGAILYGIASAGASSDAVRPGRNAGAKKLLALVGETLGTGGAATLTGLALAALTAWLVLRLVRRPKAPVLVPEEARVGA